MPKTQCSKEMEERLRSNDDTLTKLDLSYNNLGEKGGAEVAKALLTNTRGSPVLPAIYIGYRASDYAHRD